MEEDVASPSRLEWPLLLLNKNNLILFFFQILVQKVQTADLLSTESKLSVSGQCLVVQGPVSWLERDSRMLTSFLVELS